MTKKEEVGGYQNLAAQKKDTLSPLRRQYLLAADRISKSQRKTPMTLEKRENLTTSDISGQVRQLVLTKLKKHERQE